MSSVDDRKSSNNSRRTAKIMAVAAVLFLLGGVALKIWLAGAPQETHQGEGMPTAQVVLNGHAYTVEVAKTRAQITRGLMHRPHLADDRGMLFLGERPQPISFWMKNTLIPLDIIFLDDQWKVVGLHSNVPPCEADPCPAYPSPGPAMHVLEINAGQAKALGVEPGVFLSVPAELTGNNNLL